ncbi:MAG: hypothetical protein ABIO79_08860 [Ferruginibacter sp.]
MKKIFFFSTIILLLSFTASAQIKKGAIFLGGLVSVYHSNIDYDSPQPDQKLSSASFNISAGVALKENAVAGLYVTYGHGKFDNNYNGGGYSNTKLNRYNAGAFFRRYKKLVKDFYFFGELGAGYFGSNQTDVNFPGNNEINYTESGAELYLSPGISYRVFKKLHVELAIPQIAGLQYGVTKMTSQVRNSKQDQFQFNTNLNSSFLNNLALGFRFIL